MPTFASRVIAAAAVLIGMCVAGNAVVAYACIATAHAAQVQPLNTLTATPAIASFNIPSGKHRVLFIWPTFERNHCSPANGIGGTPSGDTRFMNISTSPSGSLAGTSFFSVI
ncbi:MAG: hypothetical protein WAZ48_04835 [Lysobacteraceae bacterium]